MSRREFPAAVKRDAYARCGGRCEGCGGEFGPANGPEYDHRVEDALGGEPTLENCQVLGAKCCHRRKSIERAAPVAKALRLDRKAANIVAKKRELPGSRRSPWKQKIGGGWIRREED